MRRRIAAALVMLLATVVAGAQIPVRTERLVYSVQAFDGRGYVGTFVLDDAPAIYLMADSDSFLTLRKTFVFFWPITGEWQTNTSGLDLPLDGTLEVTGRDGTETTLAPVRYTYYRLRDAEYPYWETAVGGAADEAMRRYHAVNDAYWDAIRRYNEELSAHETLVRQVSAMIAATALTGADVSSLRAALALLEPPDEPEYPSEYVTPPAAVRTGYRVNLPAGEYSIRFVSPAGRTIEGSERALVIFEERRAGTVGVEVIPGSRWTRPVESASPRSVIYTDGSTDLYLTLFGQREYNDLQYEKLRNNAARGNPLVMKWVRTETIASGSLEVAWSRRSGQTLREEAFVVEQAPGTTRGYRIVPYDPGGRHAGEAPTVRAFHVPVDRTAAARAVARLSARAADGADLPSAARQIRVVRATPLSLVLLGIALAPLGAMTVVLVRRYRRRVPPPATHGS